MKEVTTMAIKPKLPVKPKLKFNLFDLLKLFF